MPGAGPLLRLRSDEQLVRLFRDGSEEAFRAIHDRYRMRLFAYTRQMLSGSRQDAEDVLQDVFVRAYGALRASDRDVSLRAWLYRVAHNRCIDYIRRPVAAPDALELMLRPPEHDPIALAEQRESLRRLVADVRRLPDQQRSALLMREIGGMSYDDLAGALDVTVPAIKSLLVRARVGLAAAAEARDTTCAEIREQLADAHERGVRATALARRHLSDCADCRDYRTELRSARARFAALMPALGPSALLAKLLGLGGGGGAGAAAATGGAGGAAAGGAGAAIGGGALGVTASHVVAVVAAVVVSAGGAVEVQQTLGPAAHHHHTHHATAAHVAVAGLFRSHAAHGSGHGAHANGLHGKPHTMPAAPSTTDPALAATTGGATLPPELATDPAPPSDTTAPADPSTAGSATPAPADGTGGDPAATGDDTGAANPPAATASAPGDGVNATPAPGPGDTPPANTAATP